MIITIVTQSALTARNIIKRIRLHALNRSSETTSGDQY